MASHVAGRKMRLSKLLFIAIVAICLVFVKASAQGGDEVAIENEGEALAPGAQAIEAGAEVGETQAAQDVVRSQGASTRGPTRTQSPSKVQKGNKVKIAIVIGLILIMLGLIGTAVGIFVIKPKMKASAEKKVSERLKEGLPAGVKFESKKAGDDKKERLYLVGGTEKLSDEAEKKAAGLFKKLEGMDGAKKTKEGVFISFKDLDAEKAICKALDSPIPDKCETPDKHTAGVLGGLVGGDRMIRVEGKGFLLMTNKGEEKKDGKNEKEEKKD